MVQRLQRQRRQVENEIRLPQFFRRTRRVEAFLYHDEIRSRGANRRSGGVKKYTF